MVRALQSIARWFFQLSGQTWRPDLEEAVSLCCLQDGEHSGRTTEMKQTTAVGGNRLVVTGAETEKGAEFVVSLGKSIHPGPVNDSVTAYRWLLGQGIRPSR